MPCMQYPDPNNPHPMEGFPQVCFIKNTVSNPNIIIGDYSFLVKLEIPTPYCLAIDFW